MHIIFSHGMESGPNATKVTALAKLAEQHGFSTERPDYRGMPQWQERLQALEARLVQCQSERQEVALVGSSIGAYISAIASLKCSTAGLFLLAPPIHVPDQLPMLAARCALIFVAHGWSDEIISPEQVFRFSAQYRARLLLLQADHRMSAVLPELERYFSEFLACLS
jgi:alpha/beta superfamily hydrolase